MGPVVSRWIGPGQGATRRGKLRDSSAPVASGRCPPFCSSSRTSHARAPRRRRGRAPARVFAVPGCDYRRPQRRRARLCALLKEQQPWTCARAGPGKRSVSCLRGNGVLERNSPDVRPPRGLRSGSTASWSRSSSSALCACATVVRAIRALPSWFRTGLESGQRLRVRASRSERKATVLLFVGVAHRQGRRVRAGNAAPPSSTR